MSSIWHNHNLINDKYYNIDVIDSERITFISLWPSDYIVTYIWVNIGSGDGLLPDGNKSWFVPMLTYCL